MKTRVKRKDREAFAQGVCEIAFRARGEYQGDDTGRYSWTVETKCGPLCLHVYTSAESSGLGWVAGRFPYPERAVAVLGSTSMNPYSGKWNHHFGSIPLDEAIDSFRRSLGKVLALQDGVRHTGAVA
jgi:hypothetical protein